MEGGGLLSVRALSLNAHLVTVDINGHLSADGKGNATGLGAGISELHDFCQFCNVVCKCTETGNSRTCASCRKACFARP